MFSSPLSGRTRPNDRRIRAWLACAGEASRADLARQLDLPKATVAGIVTDLIERGGVAVAPRARAAGAARARAHPDRAPPGRRWPDLVRRAAAGGARDPVRPGYGRAHVIRRAGY